MKEVKIKLENKIPTVSDVVRKQAEINKERDFFLLNTERGWHDSAKRNKINIDRLTHELNNLIEVEADEKD